MTTEYHKIDTVFKRDQKGHITDEFSCPEFHYLRNNEWEFTEKIDGTNIRLSYDPMKTPIDSAGPIHYIAGRTDNAQIPPHLLKYLVELYQKTPWEDVFDSPVVIYGEGYGAKIQKGGGNYISDGVGFIVFDIKIGDWWLKRYVVENLCSQIGLLSAPIVDRGTLYEGVELARNGLRSNWPKVEHAEGLVMRPTVELFNRGGERIITKIKTKDFR